MYAVNAMAKLSERREHSGGQKPSGKTRARKGGFKRGNIEGVTKTHRAIHLLAQLVNHVREHHVLGARRGQVLQGKSSFSKQG